MENRIHSQVFSFSILCFFHYIILPLNREKFGYRNLKWWEVYCMFIYLHMAPVPSPYVRQIPQMLLIHRISFNDFTYGPHKCFKIITGPYCSSGLIISTSGDKKSKEEKQLLHLVLMKWFSFISSQIIKFIKLDKKITSK